MTSQNFFVIGNSDVAANFYSKIDQGAVSTTDATVTTIWSVVIAEQMVATFFVLWSAHQDDHSEAGGGTIVASVHRDAGGNVTLIGTPTVIDEDNSLGTITATMDVDTGSQTARIRITGVAATNLDWAVTVIYQTRTT